MKRLSPVVAFLSAMFLVAGAAHAQDDSASPASLQQQIDQLRTRLEELETALQNAQAAPEAEQYEGEKTPKRPATGERVKLSGFVQSQITNDEAADPRTEFRVRHARVKLQAAATDMANLTLQIELATSVTLKDAYLDLGRSTHMWRLRTGQSKAPFMYDVLESTARRLEPERTTLARTLFKGERDIGAWLHFKNITGDRMPGATLDLGVMNGNGPNASDNNNNKDLIARLRFLLGGQKLDKNKEANTLYIGYLDGKSTDGGVTTDKERLGGGISYMLGPMCFRGEFVTGENLGNDVQGWYARVAYPLSHRPDTLFARYEIYDEDTDVANTDFRNLTVGIERILDEKTRAVLAHEFRDPDPGYSELSSTDGDVTTLRLQVKS